MTKDIARRFIMLAFLLASRLTSLSAQTAVAPTSGKQEPELTPQQQAKLEEAEKLFLTFTELKGQSRYAQAVKYAEQVLVIRKEVFGEKHSEYATGINELATLYDDMGDYAAAEPLYRRAAEIFKEVSGEKHPNYSTSLNNLARVYQNMGNYAKAASLYQQVVAIDKEVLGERDPNYATHLSNLATLYSSLGDYAQAEVLFQQALTIRKEALGENHPLFAQSLNNLAVHSAQLGDFTKAEKLYRQALAIDKESLGEKHPGYATDLNNLAHLYKDLGDYTRAEETYRQAQSIRKDVLGSNHPDYAQTLNDLAQLCDAMGNYPKAESLYRQALAIRRKVLGEKHPSYAESLNDLAALYVTMGNNIQAEPLYRQALMIDRETVGEQHLSYAIDLSNLAGLYSSRGDYAQAEPLYRQALAIKKQVFGQTHPSYANAINNLAILYMNLGDYRQAEPLLRQALMIRKTALGEMHPDVALSFNNLSGAYAAAKNWRAAADCEMQARRVIRRHTSRVLPGVSAKEQVMFLRKTDEGPFHAALSLGLQQQDDQRIVDQSASWLANGKAVAQEALAQRALLARLSDHAEVENLTKKMEETRRQLASLIYAAPKQGQESARREQIEKLESQENELGRRIASTAGQVYQDDPWIELDALRQAIPAGTVLIDVARFDMFNFQAKGTENNFGPARYAAWILPPAGRGDVKIVDLGEAQRIDDAVQSMQQTMRAAMGSGNNKGTISGQGEVEAEQQIQKPLADLARLVLEPLIKRIPQDTQQILFSPDGKLWLVPWGALPIGEDKYAIEKYQIRYLVSARDLVVQKTTNKATTQPVVFADPNYDLGPGQVESATRSVLRSAVADNAALRSLSDGKSASVLPKVGRLKGTAAEAAAIKSNLASYVHQEPIIYLDQYATEGVFKQVHRPQVLVLSTHGFFLDDQEVKHDARGPGAPRLANDNQRSALVLTVDGKPVENPLLRCGLLLAGCNKSGDNSSSQRSPTRGEGVTASRDRLGAEIGSDKSGMDDGILTGMEIVGTDLRGTDLVVLSACETGLGEVRNGEGVAGLRQAFQLAGAKSVVATLWQIPDQDTAQIVSRFVTNLAEGQSKSDALRNAQLAQIELHRSRFGAAHPFFWAAFTITGE